VDDLLLRADECRAAAQRAVNPSRQAQLGQFFTPVRAAALVASLPDTSRLPTTVRVLDPGAGSGMLTAAVVARLRHERPEVRVSVTAVEKDPALIRHLHATLADCAVGGAVDFRIVNADYLLTGTGLMHDPAVRGPFDLVVMNPPYGKLAAADTSRLAVAAEHVDAPNLYAAFWALGVASLAPGGQCVAIVPRSWANGTYFEPFRRWLLEHLALDRLHTFESRSTVFADTGVLQENVIVSGTLAERQNAVVALSTSVGHEDAATRTTVPLSVVLPAGDPHRFVRFSADTVAMPPTAACRLSDLGITVSTGRVVDFRSRPYLVQRADTPDAAPLIYPGNVRDGRVQWPRPIGKPQGFLVAAEEARRLLVPAGTYTVVKRFSAKEERRRIVAGVWDGPTAVAIENHLNYFHEAGHGLEPALARGLSAWLNTTVVDQLFRTFSGHTQVNAGDLRTLPYPNREDLAAMGRAVGPDLPTQDRLDTLMNTILAREAAA